MLRRVRRRRLRRRKGVAASQSPSPVKSSGVVSAAGTKKKTKEGHRVLRRVWMRKGAAALEKKNLKI